MSNLFRIVLLFCFTVLWNGVMCLRMAHRCSFTSHSDDTRFKIHRCLLVLFVWVCVLYRYFLILYEENSSLRCACYLLLYWMLKICVLFNRIICSNWDCFTWTTEEKKANKKRKKRQYNRFGFHISNVSMSIIQSLCFIFTDFHALQLTYARIQSIHEPSHTDYAYTH